jgi:hypothetical protein
VNSWEQSRAVRYKTQKFCSSSLSQREMPRCSMKTPQPSPSVPVGSGPLSLKNIHQSRKCRRLHFRGCGMSIFLLGYSSSSPTIVCWWLFVEVFMQYMIFVYHTYGRHWTCSMRPRYVYHELLGLRHRARVHRPHTLLRTLRPLFFRLLFHFLISFLLLLALLLVFLRSIFNLNLTTV